MKRCLLSTISALSLHGGLGQEATNIKPGEIEHFPKSEVVNPSTSAITWVKFHPSYVPTFFLSNRSLRLEIDMRPEKQFRLTTVKLAELNFTKATSKRIWKGMYMGCLELRIPSKEKIKSLTWNLTDKDLSSKHGVTERLNKRPPTITEELDHLTLHCKPEDKKPLLEELRKL